MKRFLIYAYCLIFSVSLYSQGLPNTAFPSLRLIPSARLASLSDGFATSYEPRIDLAISNASLNSPTLHNVAMINYTDYFSAYSCVNAAYARQFPKIGMFLASLQYLNFGSVENYDEFSNYFGPSNRFYDVILNVGWGRALVDSVFSIGANFKYIFSRGDNFWLSGIAVDVSATYTGFPLLISDHATMSLAFRNIGTVLKRDLISDYDKLPFQIDLALYERAKHAPFAYSLIVSNLQKWNLSGVDLNKKTVAATGDTITPNKVSAFFDNAMRHLIPGVEIFPFRNFAFRLSYNYQRRQELKTDARPGAVGISWGVGLKIYKFQIDYARSAWHLAGAPNYISVSANLNDF
ncbi:MAG: type IX secretion system protein PorQ [Bacteroidales bacterium]|nr:type IX secretion system protein PorQ [Bacteroidales bacterium]